MAEITPAMKTALLALKANSGEGCIDRFGKIVAAGEVLFYDPVTWLRLMTWGLVEPAGKLRIRLTAEGRALE